MKASKKGTATRGQLGSQILLEGNQAPSSLAKITQPAVGRSIQRERVSALLSEATHYKVVWIAAPAGYGKTTAVSSHLKGTEALSRISPTVLGKSSPP